MQKSIIWWLCEKVDEYFADDVIETANLFRCIDMIIETAKAALTEKYIKELRAVFAPLRKKCKCKKIVMDIKNSLVVEWHY